MTFEQLIAILRARWLIASATFAIVLGTIAGVTLWMPKNYTAVATVLVDVKPDPILGAVLNGGATTAFMMTQVDIITSRRVAEKVVKALNLSNSSALRAQWQEATGGKVDFNSWAANLVRGGVTAQPSRGSNTVLVMYSSPDPNFASALANAFVAGYLETVMELRTGPAKQFSTFFDTSAKQIKEQLEQAQGRLLAFQRSEGLIATDERLDIETARLNELSSQLVAAQASLADTGSRQAAALSQGDKSPDVMSSPLVASLKADVLRAESQLAQMSTKLGDQHPNVIELRTNVAETRTRLESEIRRATSSVGVSNSVNASRTAQIRAALEEQRAKVFKLKSARDQAANLQRDVDNAQRAYDGVLARLNTTSLESQVAQANVSVLETASPPAFPSSPRVVTNIVFGGLLAVVLALSLTLGTEYFDRRVRTRGEIEAFFEHPLIAVVPSFTKVMNTKNHAGTPRRLSVGPALKALTK